MSNEKMDFRVDSSGQKKIINISSIRKITATLKNHIANPEYHDMLPYFMNEHIKKKSFLTTIPHHHQVGISVGALRLSFI